jgi:DNA/RNA endonuclease YhcR with UshA esterase domain
MRNIAALFSCLALTAGLLVAAEQGEAVKPIKPSEARQQVGTNAVVVGKVAEVHKSDKVAQLNFEQKFPKQDFSAVVFAKNFGVFTNLDTLEGKTVEVNGKISEFKGKAQIILNTKSQLRVVE